MCKVSKFGVKYLFQEIGYFKKEILYALLISVIMLEYISANIIIIVVQIIEFDEPSHSPSLYLSQ